MDKELTENVGPTSRDEVLATLKKIEKHLRALVYYSTPEKAFMPSAGAAKTIQPKSEKLEETIVKEISNYLKENK
jgi:hypothetical protein